MSMNTGLYTLNEQTSRVVTKLAPDVFVTFMGSTDVRVAMAGSKTSSMDMKAGLTSVNVVADNTPGGGRCTITMVCPQYDSLNQTYYLTQPNGVKTPFFTAMMEVRVFAKARFLDDSGNPSYYPIFWGYIRAVNETYTGSETSFSLNCSNMLGWWERQIVNLNLVAGQQAYGGGGFQPACNTYRLMNPWEIILNLFYDTSFNNFMYPSTIGENGSAIPSLLDNFFRETRTFGGLGGYSAIADKVTADWRDRYGFGTVLASDASKASGVANLEMFGMSKVIKINDATNSPFTLVDRARAADQFPPSDSPRFGGKRLADNITNKPTRVASKDASADKAQGQTNTGDLVFRAINPHVTDDSAVDLDFGILGKVMPYGDWMSDTNPSIPHRKSKLEIAAEISKAIGFEFYQDTNGMFVFKPPFYNMDTSRSKIYHIKQSDIIHFDEAVDAGLIVTWIRASGARLQQTPQPAIEGIHFDVGLMRQFGIKEQVLKLPFGFSAEVVRAQAACEMSKANAKAFSASLTIPMRPEIRVGYPVYIEHIDAYYYVKQVSHALTFGGNAVTSLTLEAKRAKVLGDDGKVLKGYIYKAFRALKKNKDQKASDVDINNMKELDRQLASNYKRSKVAITDNADKVNKTNYFAQQPTLSEAYMIGHNLISSPAPGSYMPVPADSFAAITNPTSDVSAKTRLKSLSSKNGTLSDLVLYTLDTTPYTDVNGYQHIGGFPYGATLVLGDDATIQDAASESINLNANMIASIRPEGAINPDINPLGELVSQKAQYAPPLDHGVVPAANAKPDPDTSDATNVANLQNISKKTQTAAILAAIRKKTPAASVLVGVAP